MKKMGMRSGSKKISKLDFETLRVKSAALGNSLNARHHTPESRNKSL
jgi:hypothetical protein